MTCFETPDVSMHVCKRPLRVKLLISLVWLEETSYVYDLCAELCGV